MRRLKNPKYQKLFTLIAVGFAFVMIGFFGHAPSAHADSSVMKWIFGDPLILAANIVWAINYWLNQLLSVALALASYLLDQLFVYNVVLNPSNMPAVLQGWSIIRDVANGLFILIVLWVALTIIFNLEQFGGRRLLFRIIVVALLINFSLVAVSVTFGFANALAKPFRDNILNIGAGQTSGGRDLGGFIVDKLKIQALSAAPDPQNAQVQNAALVANPQECGLGAITTSAAAPQDCRMEGGQAGFTNQAQGVGASIGEAQTTFNQILTLGLANIILLVITLSFLASAGMLLGRIIAMSFLGILAPAAFFSIIIPFGHADSLWTSWKKNLFCWAFFLPIYYFMMYISFLMLAAMTNSDIYQTIKNPLTSMIFIITVAVFLGFLWVATTIGKKMSCTGADTLMKLGKTVGGLAVGTAAAVATGGGSLALRAGAAGARGIAKTDTAQDTLEYMSDTPVLRNIAAPIARKRAELLQKEQDDIDKRKKQLVGSPRDLATLAKGSLNTRDQVAAMEKLAEGGDIDKLDGFSQKKIFEKAKNLGRDKALEKVLPELAGDATAINEAVKRIRPTDVGKISKTSFDSPEALNKFIDNFKAEHYKTLSRENPEGLEKVFKHIENNPTSTETMPQGAWNYLHSAAASELGPTLPAGVAKPKAQTPQQGGQQNQPQTPQPLKITSTGIPNGRVGQNYPAQVDAQGGSGGLTWSASGLPTGLQIAPKTGSIYGSPQSPGSHTVTVTITDGSGASTQETFQMNVTP